MPIQTRPLLVEYYHGQYAWFAWAIGKVQCTEKQVVVPVLNIGDGLLVLGHCGSEQVWGQPSTGGW